jgi:HK97 family phage major capsid protein
MPNQIPLSEGVLAAGGHLVPEAVRETLLSKVNRQAAIIQLSGSERITTNRGYWPVYLGRPTAAFVGEGAAKPVTGAEFGRLDVTIKKIATNIIYTEEMIEDSRENPEVLVNPDVEAAFSDLIDKHAVGWHAGGADATATFSTSFDNALANTAQAVELGTSADAIALALSEAMERIESNGYEPNGVAAAFDVKRPLRDARDADGRPLYRNDFSGDVPTLEGLRLATSTNLDGYPAGLVGGAGSPAKVAMIVGDFRNAKPVIRTDIRVRRFTEATIGGYNLAENNEIALQWEMRLGFQVFDRDRAFAKIVNAA